MNLVEAFIKRLTRKEQKQIKMFNIKVFPLTFDPFRSINLAE